VLIKKKRVHEANAAGKLKKWWGDN